MINFLRHTTRIILSAIAGFWALKFINFDSFGNIIMFMAIYIGISLIIEPFFEWLEKKLKTENTEKHTSISKNNRKK